MLFCGIILFVLLFGLVELFEERQLIGAHVTFDVGSDFQAFQDGFGLDAELNCNDISAFFYGSIGDLLITVGIDFIDGDVQHTALEIAVFRIGFATEGLAEFFEGKDAPVLFQFTIVNRIYQLVEANRVLTFEIEGINQRGINRSSFCRKSNLSISQKRLLNTYTIFPSAAHSKYTVSPIFAFLYTSSIRIQPSP